MGKFFLSFFLLCSSFGFSSSSSYETDPEKLHENSTLYEYDEIRLIAKKGLSKAKLLLSDEKEFHFFIGSSLYYKLLTLKEKARREKKQIRLHLLNLFHYVRKQEKEITLNKIVWISKEEQELPVAHAEPLGARAIRVPSVPSYNPEYK